MLVSYHDIIKVLPVIQLELYGVQHCFLIQTNLLKNILEIILLSYLDAKKLNPSYKVVIFDYQFCNNIRKDRDL